jgi:mitochondrial fission protein ELM1
LIITSPQFRLPAAANVVELTLPLHRLDQEAMGKAAVLVAPKLSALPRPWITLLVGGTSTPDVLDGATASDLARKALTYAEERKGSLVVVTSPRTGRKAERAIAETLDGLAHICLWSRDADANHYLGYLHLADSFIVTSDSISMIAEAIHTGKPVDVFNLPQRTTWLQSAINWLHERNRLAISQVLFDSGFIEVRTNRHLVLDELKKQGLLSSRNTHPDGHGNTQIQAVKARVLELIYGRNSGKFVSS